MIEGLEVGELEGVSCPELELRRVGARRDRGGVEGYLGWGGVWDPGTGIT